MIKFCWATPVPIILQYNNKKVVVMDTKTIVKAKSHSDVINRLKGTNSK